MCFFERKQKSKSSKKSKSSQRNEKRNLLTKFNEYVFNYGTLTGLPLENWIKKNFDENYVLEFKWSKSKSEMYKGHNAIRDIFQSGL